MYGCKKRQVLPSVVGTLAKPCAPRGDGGDEFPPEPVLAPRSSLAVSRQRRVAEPFPASAGELLQFVSSFVERAHGRVLSSRAVLIGWRLGHAALPADRQA